MTYSQLLENTKKYEGVLSVERVLPRGIRRGIETLAAVLIVGLAVYILLDRMYILYAAGAFFITLAVWLLFVGFEAYFYSYYFPEKDVRSPTFELASILFVTNVENLTYGVLTSVIGEEARRRVGLTEEDVQEFRETSTKPLTGFAAEFEGNTYTVASYVRQVVAQDQDFQKFLFTKGVQTEDFLASIAWVIQRVHYVKRKQRWWSEDRLSQFGGIGVEWSYGQAYLLSELSRPLVAQHPSLTSVDFFGEYTASLESILTRNRNANALIVGEPGVGKEDVIIGLKQQINAQKTDPVLRNMDLVKIDMHVFGSKVGTKQEFEEMVINVFTQAQEAGNVILVVPLSDFIRLGDEYNTDAISLLDPYLMSNDLHVIGYVDTGSYHKNIEKNAKVMQRFERILIKEGDEAVRIKILLDEALQVEQAQKVFFTYQAIEAVARSANRYFTGTSDIEKSTDLLYEIATNVRHSGRDVIRVDDVDAIVERLTGVPVGNAKGEEREKLLNLEEKLHTRVIGQDEAIKAISDALRRARSGLADPRRPMGSFLFLGPTGVGKTETTKALSEIFFGDSGKVVRLDMSEFTGADALERLIGRDERVLAVALRDTPYGVLHLDEFEKTNREVLNLFLQILDEGMFTDATGEEINVRNMIVVATSNAGSDVIFEYLKDGGSGEEFKDSVISTIIKRGTFSPELLNRFDGTILFHPLNDSHLGKVAELLLKKLNSRLSEKGLTLSVTPELISFLVKKGSDPKFGARPLRRAVQDHIESVIAEKMVRGDVASGSTITLTPEELEGVPVKETISDDHSFTFVDEE